MKKRFWINCLGFVAMLSALAGAPAVADETVSISGSRAVLIKPKAPRASVILMPGGDGSIRPGEEGDIHGLVGNQLVRTRHAYADLGLAVLVVDVSTDLGSAVEYMAAIKRPVTVIATSAGTIRAAQGIWRGARPDALVLTSGCSVRNRAAAMTRRFWRRDYSARNRAAAKMSCRSSVHRHCCHPRSSSITVRMGAHCRPESSRSSNGRWGMPARLGSAAERTKAIPVKPLPTMASMASTARSWELPGAFADLRDCGSLCISIRKTKELYPAQQSSRANRATIHARLPAIPK
jgi:hypothetical protein